MLHRTKFLPGSPHLASWAQQVHRQCTCRAKRGRPRKTQAEEAPTFEEFQQPVDTGYKPVSRRGRRSRSAVQAEEPVASAVESAAPGQHNYIGSLEMLQSAELDYNEDANIADSAPPYTHAYQGPDSNELPPLMGLAYEGSGFVGDEGFEFERQKQKQEQGLPAEGTAAALIRQQQQQLTGLPSEGSDDEVDDATRNQEIPPGVYDYEAGLRYAQTTHDPPQLQQYFPPQFRPRSRKEAEYAMNWANMVFCAERDKIQLDYEDKARWYMCEQNREAENIYSNAKAVAIVTAEIEIEDHETGNRWDPFYPVWARAEHRWYPSGRFHAYNEYVKNNIADLTMKYAPGHEQEEDFDLMDDAFLLGDDPNMPGAVTTQERALGPAEGLGLDSFIEGVLPGAASSELGQSYLEEVLASQEEDLPSEDVE